jgi:hypothetical protein
MLTGSNPYTLPISSFTTSGDLTVTVGIIGSVKVPIFYYVPPTGISLDKTSLSFYIGGTQKLTATVEPSNATNKEVTWKSSDVSITTVSSIGQVTGVSAGSATITATTVDGGYTATCSVTVTVPKLDLALASLLNLNKKTGFSCAIGNLNIAELQSIGYTTMRITLKCSITRKTVFGGRILGQIFCSDLSEEIGNLSHIPSYNKQETFEIDIWRNINSKLSSLIVKLTVPDGGNSGDDYVVNNLKISIQAIK